MKGWSRVLSIFFGTSGHECNPKLALGCMKRVADRNADAEWFCKVFANGLPASVNDPEPTKRILDVLAVFRAMCAADENDLRATFFSYAKQFYPEISKKEFYPFENFAQRRQHYDRLRNAEFRPYQCGQMRLFNGELEEFRAIFSDPFETNVSHTLELRGKKYHDLDLLRLLAVEYDVDTFFPILIRKAPDLRRMIYQRAKRNHKFYTAHFRAQVWYQLCTQRKMPPEIKYWANRKLKRIFSAPEPPLSYNHHWTKPKELESRERVRIQDEKNAFVRAGCNAWCIAARRMGICKDLRRVIARKVWKHRHLRCTRKRTMNEEEEEGSF